MTQYLSQVNDTVPLQGQWHSTSTRPMTQYLSKANDEVPHMWMRNFLENFPRYMTHFPKARCVLQRPITQKKRLRNKLQSFWHSLSRADSEV